MPFKLYTNEIDDPNANAYIFRLLPAAAQLPLLSLGGADFVEQRHIDKPH